MAAITLTYTAQQASRLATAYGNYLGLGQDANAAQIKAEIWNQQRLLVQAYERKVAEAAAQATADAALTDLGIVT